MLLRGEEWAGCGSGRTVASGRAPTFPSPLSWLPFPTCLPPPLQLQAPRIQDQGGGSSGRKAGGLSLLPSLSFLVCRSPPSLRHTPLCLMEPTRGIERPPDLFRGPAGQGWGAAWRRSHRLGFPLCGGGLG